MPHTILFLLNKIKLLNKLVLHENNVIGRAHYRGVAEAHNSHSIPFSLPSLHLHVSTVTAVTITTKLTISTLLEKYPTKMGGAQRPRQ